MEEQETVSPSQNQVEENPEASQPARPNCQLSAVSSSDYTTDIAITRLQDIFIICMFTSDGAESVIGCASVLSDEQVYEGMCCTACSFRRTDF